MVNFPLDNLILTATFILGNLKETDIKTFKFKNAKALQSSCHGHTGKFPCIRNNNKRPLSS